MRIPTRTRDTLRHLLTGGAVAVALTLTTVPAQADDVKPLCLNGRPIIQIPAAVIDPLLKTHVVPKVGEVLTDTDYNNQWWQATDMWTIHDGIHLNFEWTFQWHTEFIPGWFGGSGSGSAKMQLYMDYNKIYTAVYDVNISDNEFINDLADWIGANDYLKSEADTWVYNNFGGGRDIRLLIGDEWGPLFEGYNIDKDTAYQTIDALAQHSLWVRIYHDATNVGLSNWNPPEGQLSSTEVALWWQAIESMCPAPR